jgi:hypothetical protein
MRLALWTLLLLVVAATASFAIAGAQEGESACQIECSDRMRACIDVCSEHENPIECESDCRNDAWVCKNDCP